MSEKKLVIAVNSIFVGVLLCLLFIPMMVFNKNKINKEKTLSIKHIVGIEWNNDNEKPHIEKNDEKYEELKQTATEDKWYRKTTSMWNC